MSLSSLSGETADLAVAWGMLQPLLTSVKSGNNRDQTQTLLLTVPNLCVAKRLWLKARQKERAMVEDRKAVTAADSIQQA